MSKANTDFHIYDAVDKRDLERSLLSIENLNCQVIVS